MENPSFINPFTNIPKVSKILASILVSFYIIGVLFPNAKDVFALVPGNTIPPKFRIWNLVTAGFFEMSIIDVVLDSVAVLLFGKYLEPIWSSKEFVRFILIVNTCCGVSTFIFMIFLYYFTGNLNLWFNTYLCGFHGALGGFTVAIKQLIPDQQISIFSPSLQVRARHLPGIFLLTNVVFFLLRFPSESFPFAMFGLWFSWVYLRFYQKKSEVIGDRNESFSFASFFPDPLHKPIGIISTIIWTTWKLCCRCCIPGVTQTTSTTDSSSTIDDPDTERRRAKALRALDQRMQQTKPAPTDAPAEVNIV